MIRLDTTTRKLQLQLAGAVATLQLPCMVSYSDKTATTYNGGTQVSNSNSTTLVDICAAPAAATVRDIDAIEIWNRDTAPATVKLFYNDNGTSYQILQVVMDIGDTLLYTHGDGWRVLDSSGGLHQTGGVSVVTGTANEITVSAGPSPVVSLPAAITLTGKTLTGGSFASPALTGTPTAPTAVGGTNTTQIATTAFAQAALAALVAAAPATLDTLNELALALASDPNFATTMTNALALKAPIASPTFTGNPAAPTPAQGDNDTSLATSAFVIGEENKHKNFLHNGDFQVAQRSTSGNPVANTVTYQLDRWFTYQVGGSTGNFTVSRQVINDGVSQFAMRVARTAGTVADSRHRQIIESIDATKLAGKTVTISFRARKGSAYSAASSNLLFVVTTGTGADQGAATGEGGGWTGQANPVTVNDVLTTSFQNFSHTFAVGSTITEIAIGFNPTWVGTGAANDYFDIADVQLELGSVATAFEQVTYPVMLAICQRFLPVFNSTSGADMLPGFASALSTTQAGFNVNFPVTTRSVLSGIVVSSAGHFHLNDGVNDFTATVISFSTSGKNSNHLIISVASGLTQFRPYIMYMGSASAQLLFTGAEM